MKKELNPKKVRQAKTLEKMKQTRYDDTLFLRDIISKKFAWAIEEKQKGLVTIKQLENRLVEVKKSILKLDGCILTLSEIIAIKNEKKKS